MVADNRLPVMADRSVSDTDSPQPIERSISSHERLQDAQQYDVGYRVTLLALFGSVSE